MNNRVKVPGWLASLLQSRKFWLGVLAVVLASLMLARGEITADRWVDAVIALAGIIILAIAAEDSAEKLGLNRPVVIEMPRDENEASDEPKTFFE